MTPNFEVKLSATAMNRWRILAGIGAVALVAALFVSPSSAWAALAAGYLLTGFGLAGLVFVAIQYACGAGWSVAFRRVPEAMTAILPVGLLALALVFVARPSLYPWTSHETHAGFQRFWLRWPFFFGRAVVYMAVWTAFAIAMVRTSRRQDDDGAVSHTRRAVHLSIVFLIAFALTFWLASFDWIMSLDPSWASTIFGIYNFAGMFSGGLALLILLVLWLRRGVLRDFVNEEHLHDLGKMLFAFSTFWMYIWFSQYMLIWYADIGEETSYYVARLHNAWGPLFLLNVVLNGAAPFAALLPRAPKRSPRALARVSAVVLAGRVLDVYLMIAPTSQGGHPHIDIAGLGLLLGVAAAVVLAFYRGIRTASPVPVNDPYLEESLHYHNA